MPRKREEQLTKCCKDMWDRRTFERALASVLFWGALTYLYGFLNFTISHDSLTDLVMGYTWKIQLGRFLSPVYCQLIRGKLTIVWVIGFLALLFLLLAVYALSRAASITTTGGVFILAGVLTAIPSTFLLAVTYINDFDVNMLALLFAVLAICAWKKGQSDGSRWDALRYPSVWGCIKAISASWSPA